MRLIAGLTLAVWFLATTDLTAQQSSVCDCSKGDCITVDPPKIPVRPKKQNHRGLQRQAVTPSPPRRPPSVRPPTIASRICSCALDVFPLPPLAITSQDALKYFSPDTLATMQFNVQPFDEFIEPKHKKNWLLYGLLAGGTIYALWPQHTNEVHRPVVPPTTPVPEPNSIALLAVGMIVLGAAAFRKSV